jgi:hypothetical protein
MPKHILVVVAAGLLVAAEKPTEIAKSHAKIITEIKKLGGHVGVDEDRPGKPIVAVALYCTKVTDAWLANLKGWATLEDLCLSNTKVTDAGLIHLSGLKQLQVLDLAFTKVTDAGLRHVSGLQKLQWLDLCGTSVTDAGLKHLTRLRDLEFLHVARTKVTKKGLKMIRKALPKCIVIDEPR